MKPTGRKAHMLFAKVALDCLIKNQRLPKSSDVALVAPVHPATARRWLADTRAVLSRKAREHSRVSLSVSLHFRPHARRTHALKLLGRP